MFRFVPFIFLYIFISCSNSKIENRSKLEEENWPIVINPWINPEIKKKGELIYPDSLKNIGVKGTVWIKCLIDTTGRIIKSEIIKSENDLLNNAALETVNNYIFYPARVNGRKIRVNIIIPIEYK